MAESYRDINYSFTPAAHRMIRQIASELGISINQAFEHVAKDYLRGKKLSSTTVQPKRRCYKLRINAEVDRRLRAHAVAAGLLPSHILELAIRERAKILKLDDA